jgi:hypothetical protein
LARPTRTTGIDPDLAVLTARLDAADPI